MIGTRSDLTDQEIDALCEGLRQNAAKARYLRGLGLTVHTRPNGRPLVVRSHAERVLAGEQINPTTPAAANDSRSTSPATNRAALVALFGRRAA